MSCPLASIATRPTLFGLSLCLLILDVVAATKPVLAQAEYDRAEAAYMQNDVEASEAAYREAVFKDTSRSHRERAAVTIAAIEWRIRGDTSAALRALSYMGDSAPVSLTLERSRMHAALGDFLAARSDAKAAQSRARTARDSLDALLRLAEATVEPMIREHLYPQAKASDIGAHQLLPKLVGELRDAVLLRPGELEPARLLIDAGALATDGPALLLGFQSYYLVGTGDTSLGPLRKPRRGLSTLLPSWAGGTTGKSDRAVSHALSAASLFDAAAVVATHQSYSDSGGASDREIIAYSRFLRDVRDITDRYYQATALHKGNEKEWRSQVTTLAASLWGRLGWIRRKPPPFDIDRFASEIDHRFGAVFNLGQTAGYSDLHMGHRVVDTRRTVRQYRRTADVRFIALDGMVSNGFQSWAWDGRAAHGGWGGAKLIVQVRPGYAEAPIRAWIEVTDSALRRLSDAQISTDSVQDLKRAIVTPVAYFPSVRARLIRAGRTELLDSLRSAGDRGTHLRAEFERLYGEAGVESSIFAHEGRHAIDETIGARGDAADKEFRAKLSEVVFAPHPRLAIGSIIDENLGDASPHGQANARVARGLLEWLRIHAQEIPSINPDLPLLPQLPTLSNKQLRDAFASMDPLATFTNLAETIQTYVKDLHSLRARRAEQIIERNRQIEDGVFKVASDPRDPVTAPQRQQPAPQLNFAPLLNALDSLNHAASRYDKAYSRAVSEGRTAVAKGVNERLVQAERALTLAEGLKNRPWYVHML
jgi:transferrin receptor-like protein